MNLLTSYPLSPMQQGMLLQSLHESGVYVQQLVCDFTEDLNENLFQQAWQLVANHHEILRTAFRWQNIPEPTQDVYEHVSMPWRSEDWSNSQPQDQQESFAKFLSADRRSSFEVTAAPLFRCACFKLSERSYRFVWSFHHALLDGRSHYLVLEEVLRAYESLQQGKTPSTCKGESYDRYIDWLQRQDWSAAKDFWCEYLRGFRPPPDLRLGSQAVPATDQRQRAHGHRRLSGNQTEELKLAAERHGVTLNTLLQGAWSILLSRYYGSDDVVFGVTRACRHATVTGSEDMVGMFINTLPLRVDARPDQILSDWLKNLRRQQLSFRLYEHTPLTRIQEASEAPRGKSLFESVFVFENYELNDRINNLETNSRKGKFDLLEQTHYPLTLAAYSGEKLLLKLEYDERRFDAETIEAMLDHLVTLLAGIPNPLTERIGDLEMLTDAERQRLLFDWNRITSRPATSACLHQLFAEQARHRPDATAVIFENERLSFAELDHRSNEVAQQLKHLGVGPEVLVALCMERSLEMIVGILGILKAGGAYLPLDPAYPRERLAYMIEDSGASALLTEDNLRDRFAGQGIQVIVLDRECQISTAETEKWKMRAAAAAVSPLNVAYVIYTSGSTGKPKGVMVTHENVVRLFESTQSLFGFDQSDVWTMFHSYAFDFSVWEMWGALLYGGLLIAIPYWISRAPGKFYELVKAANVSVLNQTPSAFRQFVEADSEARKNSDSPLRLRHVILGGEALDVNSVNRWFEMHDTPPPEIINMYGITETTVHVTHHQLRRGKTGMGDATPIGKRLPDLQVYILDERRQPVPAGVAGEIYVGGAGLSRGYLNRPDLTAERFLPHPFATEPGQRLYRTGDVARFLRSGEIEYVGRSDRQVKIRGYRIELEEIESCLARHARIHDCAVIVREDRPGAKNLVAYFTATEVVNSPELRNFLTARLPDYMIPSAFVRLEKLPVTENGKLDRKALLPPPDQTVDSEFVAPRNTTEQLVAEIWREVLGLKRVSVFEDFFEIGGDSLTATQVVSRAGALFHVELPLGALFQQRSIAVLAETIEELLIEELSPKPEANAARASRS